METTEVLVLVNIILTAIVGFLSSERFKCRCGKDHSVTMLPKDAPGSLTSPRETSEDTGTTKTTQVPKPGLPVPPLQLPLQNLQTSLQTPLKPTE